MGVDQEIVFSEGSPVTGIDCTKLNVAPADRNVVADWRFGRALSRLDRAVDIVHSHGDSIVARAAAQLAARSAAAHVHTVHGGLTRDLLRWTLHRLAFPRRTHYLVVSPELAIDLQRLGILPQKVTVRPSGIRTPFLRRLDTKPEPRVVVGGRLTEQKRVAEFVDLWAAAALDDGIDLELMVFGSGPDESRIIRCSEAAASIRWLGPLSAEQVARLLRGSAVGLLLTRPAQRGEGGEGTPTLALEMLASGCTVLSTVPLTSLLDTAGATAITVLEGLPRPAEVRRAVGLALGRSLIERQVMQDALARAHSWEAVGTEVLRVYERALVDRQQAASG
ncbi:MAG: hypothetical protein QOF60_2390 [Actinomycetota bacterium]|nr:hypothetical protein [Actinomycetota bacterium]